MRPSLPGFVGHIRRFLSERRTISHAFELDLHERVNLWGRFSGSRLRIQSLKGHHASIEIKKYCYVSSFTCHPGGTYRLR
jgi:hypothetical protein